MLHCQGQLAATRAHVDTKMHESVSTRGNAERSRTGRIHCFGRSGIQSLIPRVHGFHAATVPSVR